MMVEIFQSCFNSVQQIIIKNTFSKEHSNNHLLAIIFIFAQNTFHFCSQYFTSCLTHTSKKRVTLVTGNRNFFYFSQKVYLRKGKIAEKHADIPQLPKYCPALNQIEINTCTFISTLCELFKNQK